MFDKSYLPPALFEFAVISDTHHMRDVGNQPLEFESRRRQTARAEVALRQVAALNAAFVIHLGDLSQEYPESPKFEQAIAEAQQQLGRCGVKPFHVPGNHDVGDKHDTTMPTHPANPGSLAFYHATFGPSWYSFDRKTCHFIVINSQILNGDLPETDAQWQWLEADLDTHSNKRLFLFLHLPLYLWNANEPGLGHYDNINPPARDHLLDLIQKHNVEYLFAGHVHYAFYDRIGPTRFCILQSPSFTRPGFGHLFSSEAPPERGRDDTPKLGIYLMRVLPDRTDVHLIRTDGKTESPKRTRLITGVSVDLPQSPLGITLRHPITPTGQVPLVWPSAVRQPVRNDYPFLSLLELGVTIVRIPWRDLLDPFQRKRLTMLQEEGVNLTATVLEPHQHTLPEFMATHADRIDTWEIQIPGSTLPTPEITDALKNRSPNTSIALCPILPNERVPGKQHMRTRVGYHLDELAELNDALKHHKTTIGRALCKIPPDKDPWAVIHSAQTAFGQISHVDFSIECVTEDDTENANRLAVTLFAMAQRSNARLYADPFVDLDRTMDVAHGLLDTRCNPRPAFHILRSLNTLLFSGMAERHFESPVTKCGSDCRAYGYAHSENPIWLIVPTAQTVQLPNLFPNDDQIKIHDLTAGEVETHAKHLPIRSSGPLFLTRA